MKLQLSRKTNSKLFIPEIDGLRFFAILTVVIFHLNTAFAREIDLTVIQSINFLGGANSFGWGWILMRLDLGVKVFFAISGFILALPFLRAIEEESRINVTSYFKRRLTRLEPPFIMSLFVFSVIHIVLFHESISNTCIHFLVGLFYSHTLIFGEPNFINPVTWSLETEAQFYLLIPLFFLIFRLLKSNVLKGGFLLLLFFSSMLFKNLCSSNENFGSSILAYFVNFAVGIFFAMIYIKHKNRFAQKKRVVFDLLGLFSILGMLFFYKGQSDIINILFFNVFILLFFFATFLGQYFNSFFTRKWVYTIGGMCYSIYLLHYAFFHLLVKFSKGLAFSENYGVNLSIQIAIGLPVVLLISSLFFVFVERPCMNPEWPKVLKSRMNQILKK
jgi:peptidoglycan/LPS O-acetylase OafA/YrhL